MDLGANSNEDVGGHGLTECLDYNYTTLLVVVVVIFYTPLELDKFIGFILFQCNNKISLRLMSQIINKKKAVDAQVQRRIQLLVVGIIIQKCSI